MVFRGLIGKEWFSVSDNRTYFEGLWELCEIGSSKWIVDFREVERRTVFLKLKAGNGFRRRIIEFICGNCGNEINEIE